MITPTSHSCQAPHCHFPDPQAVHRRENRLKEAAKDAGTFGVEILKGLASQRIKQEVFHSV